MLDCVVCFCILLPCRASIGQLDRSTTSISWFLSLLLFDKVLEHFKRWHTLISIRRRPLPHFRWFLYQSDSCWAARSLSRSGALASAREAISGGNNCWFLLHTSLNRDFFFFFFSPPGAPRPSKKRGIKINNKGVIFQNCHAVPCTQKINKKWFECQHVRMQIIFCCFFPYCTMYAKNQQKIICMSTCLHANYFLLIFNVLGYSLWKSTKNNLHVNMSTCKLFFVDFVRTWYGMDMTIIYIDQHFPINVQSHG